MTNGQPGGGNLFGTGRVHQSGGSREEEQGRTRETVP